MAVAFGSAKKLLSSGSETIHLADDAIVSSIWVKLAATGTGGIEELFAIAANTLSSINPAIQATGELIVRQRSIGSPWNIEYVTDSQIQRDVWVHIAIKVIRSTKAITVYVDGNPVAGSYGTAIPDTWQDGIYPVSVGQDSGAFLIADEEDFAFWAAATDPLSDADILEMATNKYRATSYTANRKLYYDLAATSGSVTDGDASLASKDLPNNPLLTIGSMSYVAGPGLIDKPVGPDPPTAPAAVAVSSSQINVTWTDNVSGSDTYTVERSPNGTTGWTAIATDIAPGTQGYSDTGLSPSTDYWYRVLASDGAADSVPSGVVTATTDAAPVVTPPSNIAATYIGSLEMEVTWTRNSTTNTSVELERSTDGAAYSPLVTLGATATSYTDTVAKETTYWYRVRNEEGGEFSVWDTMADPVQTPPQPPSGTALVVDTGVPSIVVNWIDNTTQADSYTVSRSVDGGAWDDAWRTGLAGDSETTTDLTVILGNQYCYRIRAESSLGPSSWDKDAGTCATVADGPVATLTWTNNATDEDNYGVDRQDNGGTWNNLTSTLPPATETYQDDTIVIQNRYNYRVWAENANGKSGFSNEFEIGPPLVSPTGLAAASGASIVLTWTDAVAETVVIMRDEGGGFNEMAVVPAGDGTWTDTGTSFGGSYDYYVFHRSAMGDGPTSGTVQAVSTPSPPAGLSATAINFQSIKLDWTGDGLSDITEIVIYKDTFDPPTTELKRVPAGTFTAQEVGLAESTTYFSAISAVNAAGPSAKTASVQATTAAKPDPPPLEEADSPDGFLTLSGSMDPPASPIPALWQGLLSYWGLDGNGTDSHGTRDVVGMGPGPVLWPAGYIDQAAQGNSDPGAEAYLGRAVQDGALNPNIGTVSCWVYLLLPPTTNKTACACWESDEGGRGWRLNFNSSQNVAMSWEMADGTVEVVIAGVVAVDTWYHILWRWDGEARIYQCYIDGVLSLSAAFNQGLQTGLTPWFWIMASNSSVNPTQVSDMVVDEVAVWGRYLTDQDLAWLWNGGAGLKYPLDPESFDADMTLLGYTVVQDDERNFLVTRPEWQDAVKMPRSELITHTLDLPQWVTNPDRVETDAYSSL